MRLADLVRAEMLGWADPVVERSVFGSADADAIAEALSAFARAELGAAIRDALFYRVSVGCVAGVELGDGRRVVMKVQRGTRRAAYLEACCDLRDHLRARGFPCPRTVLGPRRLGPAWIFVESLEDLGRAGDPFDPAIGPAIARALAGVVTLSEDFEGRAAFGPSWFTGVAEDRVFPQPHSPLFDFEATSEGAAWIDDLARRARAVRRPEAGRLVVGHYDFRAEHLRFEGSEIVMTYDWDSLHLDLEPVLVGLTAFNFTADWQRSVPVATPSREQMRGFVAAYEEARGEPFSEGERRVLAGSCVYAMAYRARCCHAVAADPETPGDARRPLAAYGADILARGV